ncbi:MAG: hypothetical protein KDC05_02125 [Bacteroidales bacterium]|nr:hypothetical protein [Bacteroidales bacterium]
MKKNLIIWLLLPWLTFLTYDLSSQSLYRAVTGSRSVALGNSGVALNDSWALFNNQAGIVASDGMMAMADWQNRFLVNGLSQNSVGLLFPVGSGTLGTGLQYFGYELYNESKLGIAYAKRLGENSSAGLQLDYFNRHIAEGYGNAGAITFEIGFISKLNDVLTVGVHVFNPIQAKYSGSTDEKIPSVFVVGLVYKIDESLLITAETEKNMNFKPLIRTGFEYEVVEKVAVRIGFSTQPARTGSESFSAANMYTFGFGYQLDRLIVNIAASVHQVLGWSPGVSLSYAFTRK